MRRVLSVPTAALAALFLACSASPAYADPSGARNAQILDLTCDDGTATEIVVNGNGLWTPAHDLASNAIFVPVSFGEVSGTLTDAEGNVVDTFTEPPVSKGAARNADLSCTFTGTFTFPDPTLGLITGEVTGDVTGFHTPRR